MGNPASNKGRSAVRVKRPYMSDSKRNSGKASGGGGLAIGIAIGVAIGVAMGAGQRRRKPSGRAEELHASRGQRLVRRSDVGHSEHDLG